MLGLIGGCALYSHLVNVPLLPLRQVILETQFMLRCHESLNRNEYIVVAASSEFNEKLFFLNCANGQLYVRASWLPQDGEMIPCVPNILLSSVRDSSGNQQQDAMLLWLEEHFRQLQEGIIKLWEEGNIKAISQYPEVPPLCSTAITNGVKIRASAVFVPEEVYLQPQDNSKKYLFAYSIRMSLLPDGCIINGMHYSSCQLQKRHWIISANDTVVSDVGGEGVIGKYPLLCSEENKFVYESSTSLPSCPGSIEGSLSLAVYNMLVEISS